jgi:hypothetical protein
MIGRILRMAEKTPELTQEERLLGSSRELWSLLRHRDINNEEYKRRVRARADLFRANQKRLNKGKSDREKFDKGKFG